MAMVMQEVQRPRSLTLGKMLDFPDHEMERTPSPSQNRSTVNQNCQETVKTPHKDHQEQLKELPNNKIPLPGSQISHGTPRPKERPTSDMDLMKGRFGKLLLGEDMSGGGKGVSSALALSNAITNLAASVFGEQWKLEPMSPERKQRWRKEVDWLLSVTDHIVEFVPSQQKSKNGNSMEIMVTHQRRDLLTDIPALRKLDAMLIDCLDNFRGQNEFWYVGRDADESDKGVQRCDKWWLPTVKVPPDGLSDVSRKWLQHQKDCANQVLKASLAINAQILSEMEIPDNYLESLPKNGRSSLGDSIYRSITVDSFDPDQFLSTLDLSTEHKVLDLKNRIEASTLIWKRKMNHKEFKSNWGSGVSIENRRLFEDRAETILLLLKHRFPGLPQSTLDVSKIQFNGDVGHSILESYSRVLESLANTVMSRIEDVLYADSVAKDPSLLVAKKIVTVYEDFSSSPTSSSTPSGKSSLPNTPNKGEKYDRAPNKTGGDSRARNSSMTLSDFMGWQVGQGAETEEGMKTNEDTKLKRISSYSDKIETAMFPIMRFVIANSPIKIPGLGSNRRHSWFAKHMKMRKPQR